MQAPSGIPGQNLIQRCVIVQRDQKGYGLTVTGDNPVYVQSVREDGAADVAGVRVGDKIVKVNGTLVTNSNHKEVVDLIKSGSYVALTLLGKPPSVLPLSEIVTPLVSSPTSPTVSWDNIEERIKNIRRYLEQEQIFVNRIQSQFDEKPSQKLEKELAESKKRAKALEQELNALLTNRSSILPLSGETSPTDPVFGVDLPKRLKPEAKGVYDNVPDVQGRKVNNRHISMSGDFPKSHLNFNKPAERSESFAGHRPLVRKPGYGPGSHRSRSLPGAGAHKADIVKAVTINGEESNEDESHSLDMSDSGITAVNMPYHQQSIICPDDDDFPSEDEKCEDHGPFNDLNLLNHKPAHMAVFLHYLISNSDPTSLLFWLVTEGYDEGSSKDMRKWIYEIYSTFLADGAPLKFDDDSTSEGIKKIESALSSAKCSEETLRGLLKPLRLAAAKDISLMLSDFRAKRALGLGNLFGDHQLEDDHMDRNKEITVVEQTLVHHLNNLLNEVDNLSNNFKPSAYIINQIFRSESLSWSIATFMRNVGITSKTASPNTNVLERCKTYVNKDSLSYVPSIVRGGRKDKERKKMIMGHNFHPVIYQNTTYCNLCHQLIWGIGHQGYQCQACDYNVHKLRCIEAIDEACTGRKKDRIATRPELSRRSSANALKTNDSAPALHSPDPREADSLKVGKFVDGIPTSPSRLELDKERPNSSSFDKNEARVRPSGRSKTTEVFIPGITKNDKFLDRITEPPQIESDDEEDSDLEIPTEIPNLKDVIDAKLYKTLNSKSRKRLEIINELVYTERTHVRTLKVLHKVFYKPWLKAKIEYETVGKLLFPNLEELIKIHKSLVQAMLDKRGEDGYVNEIGDVLLNRFDDQPGEEAKEAFAKFCQGQNNALELIKAKQKEKRKLDEFIQQCESNPLCRKLALQGIISSSYQRLTKYPLFLDSLLKATPSSNSDHPRLVKAIKICKQILEYVNQAVKDYEDQQHLAELSKKIDKSPLEKSNHKAAEEFKNLDLTKHKLLFDGPLTWRMSQSKYIDLHAILLEDLLVLLQKQDDKYVLKCQSMKSYQDNKTTHSPVLKLSTVLTRNVATDKKAFFIVGTSDKGPQIYELVAATIEKRRQWFKVITEAIETCKGKERGRRNAVVVTTDSLKDMDDVPEQEKEEFETKEKNDLGSEKKEGEKESIDSEEKEKDSEESKEVSSKDNLTMNVPTQKVEEFKHQQSIEPPNSAIVADGSDTDTTESLKNNSPEDSVRSSRSSVEVMELLKQKDDEIRKLLEEKSRLVEEFQGSHSIENLVSKGSVTDTNEDARSLVVESILEANHITAAVTSILSPSERSQNNEENPLPPQQQLATSTAKLNECLTKLLNVISERDINRERLQYDLQQYQGRAHKLEQQRSNSPRGLHLSHSDETFYPNYDGHGNWESLTDRLALPNNHNDIPRQLRTSSFSGCSESSRSSHGSINNSLALGDFTDQLEV
ncbi:rho guanine nucleotide exchange factor 11-like isoform X2 [Xenia sp. Carnegie-2017]|uniref:rho guanine nucleotide exchange factor 11-like isoform X2 n=1 Tax=Xenia sp. Carnegie-2017 TaxID=2897299 RepID=UPI001F039790|nr:rho guanine nucleotide exchange factor 11-like isoform X2 [Xenia sp. Carnegie-2017]